MQRLVSGPIDLEGRQQIYEQALAKNRTFMGRVLDFDQRTYLPSLLNRLDKVSMASSLECRVPFLDFNLVEWSYHLPDHMKMKVGRANKRIVKKAAEKWLPKEIVHREKVGFGTPVGDWFRNPRGLGMYLDLLTDSTFRNRGYFDAGPVNELVHEHLHEGKDHSEALWGLMNIELWCRKFIDASDLVPHTARVSRKAV
jgi:asparagine synthase (glutamine-hydrolysing)